MKKLFILIMTALTCHAGFAKTAEEVISGIKNATGAQEIRFDGQMIAQSMGNAGGLADILKGVKDGCVLMLENAGKSANDVFSGSTEELDKDSFAPIATAFDESDNVKVYGRIEEETIKELFITVTDEDDCILVYMKCDIPGDKINQLINEKTINLK